MSAHMLIVFFDVQATIKETLSRFRRDGKQFIPSIGLSTSTDSDQVVAKLIGRK